MPHTLRSVHRDSEVLAGFDADLTHECTRAINRLRSLLLQIFPALERVFPGTVLTRSLVLELFIKYSGPTGLRAAGRSNIRAHASGGRVPTPRAPNGIERTRDGRYVLHRGDIAKPDPCSDREEHSRKYGDRDDHEEHNEDHGHADVEDHEPHQHHAP
jgi:hypothetical protein